tara:strand:- start:74602 stop:75237 length:636 start_codon:yes stop_codon:yes gene_type:complete
MNTINQKERLHDALAKMNKMTTIVEAMGWKVAEALDVTAFQNAHNMEDPEIHLIAKHRDGSKLRFSCGSYALKNRIYVIEAYEHDLDFGSSANDNRTLRTFGYDRDVEVLAKAIENAMHNAAYTHSVKVAKALRKQTDDQAAFQRGVDKLEKIGAENSKDRPETFRFNHASAGEAYMSNIRLSYYGDSVSMEVNSLTLDQVEKIFKIVKSK